MLSPKETLNYLAELKHQPVHALGQNFLIDGNIVRKSLEWAQISEGESVVEVGPGLGTLTEGLLEQGAQVYAVELDPTMADFVESRLEPVFKGKFSLLRGDAVSFPRAGLPKDFSGEFKIVANLPYAISTPWMEAILKGKLPRSMTLLLQKETAERFISDYGSKNFGAISIRLKSAYAVAHTHLVSPKSFFPAPKVDSLLIHLERLETPFLWFDEIYNLVRRLFQLRRKQIRGRIQKNFSSDEQRILIPWFEGLLQQGFPETVRVEEIPLSSWQDLQRFVANCTPLG